jgi:hypothetical protein
MTVLTTGAEVGPLAHAEIKARTRVPVAANKASVRDLILNLI